MGKLYEDSIKRLILEKRHIFTDPEDKANIVFEKGIVTGSTIADCLIFSRNRGILGIEIKTEYDTTRRLNKQLKNYSLVCDYVYILCHDNHVEKTEVLLQRNKFTHVGIISYTEFKGEPILGVYKQPVKSPSKDVAAAFNMLWKTEISNLLGGFKRQMKTLEQSHNMKVDSGKSRSGGLHGLLTQSNASRKYLRKGDMITNIINRIGKEEANRVLCDIFISERMDPAKTLKFHHFSDKKPRQ